MAARSKESRDAGFSLIELVIAVSILVMMTGVLSPALIRYIERGRERRDAQNVEMVYSAAGGALYDESAYDALKSGLAKNGVYSAPFAVSALFLQEDAYADAVRDFIPTAPVLVSAEAMGADHDYEIMLCIRELVDEQTGIRTVVIGAWAGDASHCAGRDYACGVLPEGVTTDDGYSLRDQTEEDVGTIIDRN
ncbi:MAG: type II secretion system GspH family protein [Lachnospiraceae bacterium]|nr:type II secretion system GspH family protein [Lachnospiraceae bacterium]